MPLDSWTCDGCGDSITDSQKGNVIWRRDAGDRGYDFKIVHKSGVRSGCDPGWVGAEQIPSVVIESFLGASGQASLLALLSTGPLTNEAQPGVVDLDEYVDLFRRLQTPWYEEARGFFTTEHTEQWLGDANQHYPYTPEVLERIAKQNLG